MNRLMYCAVFLFLAAAAAGAQEIDVTHYSARVTFDLAAKTIDGDAELHITRAANPVVLHLRDLTVSSVTRDGSAQQFVQSDGELRVTLAQTPGPADTVVLRILYGGAPTSESGPSSWGGCFFGATTFCMGVGFYAPYVSTMRHWLPSNDIPSDKATFDVTFVVPEGQVVAGTGLLAETGPVQGGVAYRWVENHQTATYLFTYAISDYVRLTGSWQGIPTEYYVPRRDSAKGVSHFSSIPKMMEAFTRFYGPYPFDKIGYCITPIGSMEHQTMISYASQLFSSSPASSVAAHELAHQWWGDWVTPRTFAEAWLSEGFATFSEAVWAEHVSGRATYDTRRQTFASNYLRYDASQEGVHPLYDFPRTPPMSNYPSTIYNKGAAVLVMLRYVMGDSAFFRGMRGFGAGHAYGNAGTGDFRAAMDRAAGTDLSWFFDQWVYKPGWPKYRVGRYTDSTAAPLRVLVQQYQDTTKYPVFRMPVDLRITHSGGPAIIERIEVSRGSEVFTFPAIPANTVSNVELDPSNYILKEKTSVVLSAREAPTTRPEGLLLHPVYPQPYTSGQGPTATMTFELREAEALRVEIHDTLGRRVYTRALGDFDAGVHSLTLPLATLVSGHYLLRVSGAAHSGAQQIIVGR
ncbi:MAG: T9SS type A sorting domain-containing protein [Ignavibacteriae bacterium]|nr:T9SS type A sorting domain-containing protein [Ignavibacteriota bacterium]